MKRLFSSLKTTMGLNQSDAKQLHSERAVIVHAHIFKNAGTTLDWSLQRSFGKGFIDHRDDQAMLDGGGDYLNAYLNKNLHAKALSSHKLHVNFATFEGVRCYPLVLLRHPILRINSVYEFEKKQVANTPGAVQAKKMDFKTYVRWRMDPSSGATIRSFHTRYCANALTQPGKSAEALYPIAARFITEQALVGCVEKYDESVTYFEQALKPLFPAINLAYIKQNVSAKKTKSSPEEKLLALHAELGAELTQLVYQHNHCDLALYHLAQGLLQKNCKSINGFEQKLADLKERNRALSSA